MQKNIVILGAGFGGLRCALELDRAFARDSSPRESGTKNDSDGWKIVLVDRNPYHIYFPRLYELAVPQGAWNMEHQAHCVIDIRGIFKGTEVEFIQAEIKGIFCRKKVITLVNNKALPFEYLVLALGAGTDYFGIEGLEKYACTLKSVEDAEVIRERISNFLKFTKTRSLESRFQRPSLTFSIVIGGAGATGVEVAAELAYLFRKVPQKRWSITLVEALSSVLWMFPKPVGEYAHQRLTKLGVHIMLDTCIKRVDGIHPRRHPERRPAQAGSEGSRATREAWDSSPPAQNDSGLVEVVLAPRPLKPEESETALVCDFLPEHEKRISADLLLWAGGVRSTPLLSQCALPVDRKGRMEVDEYLRVKNFDNVFAIGDDATLMDPNTKQPVPATAQAALEQGKVVAENIVRLIKKRDSVSGIAIPETESLDIALRPYRFHDFPAVLPLGGHDGVAYVGGRVFIGLPTWFLRKAADCRYRASILGWCKTMRKCIMIM